MKEEGNRVRVEHIHHLIVLQQASAVLQYYNTCIYSKKTAGKPLSKHRAYRIAFAIQTLTCTYEPKVDEVIQSCTLPNTCLSPCTYLRLVHRVALQEVVRAVLWPLTASSGCLQSTLPLVCLHTLSVQACPTSPPPHPSYHAHTLPSAERTESDVGDPSADR